MAKYLILADSITGIGKKMLRKGQQHDEGEFNKEHISELIEAKLIREWTDEDEEKEKVNGEAEVKTEQPKSHADEHGSDEE